MNKCDVDLNGIKLLLMVVRAGSFSAAARLLNVPSNRVSREVLRLEESLGVRLLHRTTRRLTLTTAGHAFVEQAGPAMDELDALWRKTGAQSDVPSGYLRVAAPMDLLSIFPVERIAAFLNRFPMIKLDIRLSDEPEDMFERGVDVAFRAGPIRDEGLVARKVADSKLFVVASPACLELHGRPLGVKDLANYPCLALRSKQGHAVWHLAGMQGHEAVHVQARLTVNGMGALVAAAKAGLGAALVPDLLVVADIQAGHLVRLVPTVCLDGGGIYAVYPSRRHLPAALRAFLDFVIEEGDGLMVAQ